MKQPTSHDHEQQRLEELWRYSLRDTSNDAQLDTLTQLVAHYFEVPTTLVSFVDQRCQWFKSRHGLDVTSTPLENSFCAHAINGPHAIFEVKDTHQDARFCHNPLVTQPPYVRYYAGAPLTTQDGFKLGTLCIIDTQPRRISSKKLAQLAVFAKHAIEHLELLRLRRLLTIVDSSGIGLWELDVGSKALWRNNTQSRLLDHQGTCSTAETNYFYDAESQQRFDHAIMDAVRTRQTFSEDLRLNHSPLTSPQWVHINGVPLMTHGRVTQLVGTTQNITQLKEKEAYLARYVRIEQLINDLQATFIGNRQTQETFCHALEKLLIATESEAGFVGEVKYRDDGKTPYLKMHALTDIAWDTQKFSRFSANAPNDMAFTKLDSLFGHVMLHNQIVISNSPKSDPRAGGVPAGHPPLKSFLGLPAVDEHGHVIAVIGLANREQGYDAAFAQELEPLQQRLGQLITTYHLRQAQGEAQKRLEMAAKVFENSHNAIVIVNADFTIIDANPAFVAETGYSRDDIIGLTTAFLASPGHGLSLDDALRRCQYGDHWEGEVLNLCKNGDSLPENVSIAAVRDTTDAISHYVLVLTDLRRAKQQAQAIDRASRFDGLTGLPNRAYFLELLHKIMHSENSSGAGLAIVIIDLDRFSYANQQLGTAQGDQLLIDISHRLSQYLLEDELLARMSGDEFGLALRCDTDLLDRLTTVLSIITTHQAISRGETLTITGSVGVTFYPEDNTDPDTLLRHAFQAMFRAKEEGGNRYAIFNTRHEQAFQFTQQRRKEVAQGLANQEFILELQPQVDAKTIKLVGVEALIRWDHPDGRRAPDTFLPYIINSTLEHDVDQWVIEEAIKLLAQWQDQHVSTSVLILRRKHSPTKACSPCSTMLASTTPALIFNTYT
ncbi:MAG: diguanylate cyclase [Halomonas sp.]|nr:diguanylate cyclase [Halomonas sp.]MDP3536229.1 diguanylate cyclase [Halomonas sp.]